MVARSGAAGSGSGAVPVEAPRTPAPMPEIDLLFRGPCRCLPEPKGDWLACAYCGLRQTPGKEFCGYCGHRWVTAAEG